MPLLSELLQKVAIKLVVYSDMNPMIESITADSRQVTPGALFVAMPGIKANGAQFIPKAIAAGAAAILLADHAAAAIPAHVAALCASDMRAAIAAFAAAFYTPQPTYIMAITGTDGKTSTADFARQLAIFAGHRAASLGTLGLRSPSTKLDAEFPALNTSPEPILLHRTLAALALDGVNYVAMEASSHGLDQKRLDAVQCRAGAFTNLSRDHLDYHDTLDEYFLAKARLFSDVLAPGSAAVINRDDAHFAALKSICDTRDIRVTSIGMHADAQYQMMNLRPHAEGLSATVMMRGHYYDLDLPLYGAFQLRNILTAVGLLAACGLPEETLMPLVPQLRGVPGRLEKIANHNGAPIFVDYAHTPAALENILRTLRPHTAKKLHVVFGCGGDRDAGKRAEMGAVAASLADKIIVTDDNPRSEDPAAIRAAILSAAPKAMEVPDRAKAIRAAIRKLHTGDVLVVAGKGHETTQIIGTQHFHFNDAEHIREAVAT